MNIPQQNKSREKRTREENNDLIKKTHGERRNWAEFVSVGVTQILKSHLKCRSGPPSGLAACNEASLGSFSQESPALVSLESAPLQQHPLPALITKPSGERAAPLGALLTNKPVTRIGSKRKPEVYFFTCRRRYNNFT